MSKTRILVEIFKPEIGSFKTNGVTVLELPIFSKEIKWVYREDSKTLYVLDYQCIQGFVRNGSKFPLDFIELCNKKWDECICENNDFISFIYTFP